MKYLVLKAIIPFALLISFYAKSQAVVTSEIRDFWSNAVVTNDTIYFWVGQGQTHVWNFNQYNIGSTQVDYRYQKIYLAMQPGADALFCVFHNNDMNDPQSQCYSPQQFVSANFTTDPGEFNTLQADFTAGTQSTGTSIVQYHMWNYNNAADSVNLTLVYNVTPVGMAEAITAALGEPFPNPSNDVFSIPVNGSASGTSIEITNATGQLVAEKMQVNNSMITVDATAWSEGIYFVTLLNENGEVLARRKLVRN